MVVVGLVEGSRAVSAIAVVSSTVASIVVAEASGD